MYFIFSYVSQFGFSLVVVAFFFFFFFMFCFIVCLFVSFVFICFVLLNLLSRGTPVTKQNFFSMLLIPEMFPVGLNFYTKYYSFFFFFFFFHLGFVS